MVNHVRLVWETAISVPLVIIELGISLLRGAVSLACHPV